VVQFCLSIVCHDLNGENNKTEQTQTWLYTSTHRVISTMLQSLCTVKIITRAQCWPTHSNSSQSTLFQHCTHSQNCNSTSVSREQLIRSVHLSVYGTRRLNPLLMKIISNISLDSSILTYHIGMQLFHQYSRLHCKNNTNCFKTLNLESTADVICPLNFRLSSGLLVEGGLVFGVREWSALQTGTTAALGRHTVSADACN